MILQPSPPGADGVVDELTNEISVTLDRWSAGQNGLVDLLVAAVVIAVALVIAWVVRRIAKRYGARHGGVARSAIEGVGQLATIGVVLFAAALVLEVLGFGLGPIVILVVLLAIALLLVRPMITNLSTGLLLQVRGVFNLGDLIETHGIVGTVDEITSRTVVIHTADGRRVHIPNTDVLNGIITNHTALGRRRSTVELTVSTATDLDALDHAAQRAARSARDNGVEGPIEVLVDRVEGSTPVVALRFWHPPSMGADVAAKDVLLRLALRELADAGVDLSDHALIVRRPTGADPVANDEPTEDRT